MKQTNHPTASKIKMSIPKIFIIAIVIITSNKLVAQTTRSVSFDVSASFLQIKDKYNYGLAHHGGNFSFGLVKEKRTGDKIISWKSNLAVGAIYNKGIGINLHLSPLQYSQSYKVNIGNIHSSFVGGYVASHFFYQLYPELKNGQMFWLSSQEIGVLFSFDVPVKNRTFSLQFSNSLLSLHSRPKLGTEEYFYSIKFKDFIKNPFTNFYLGTVNSNTHTSFTIHTSLANKSNVAYRVNYFRVANPGYKYLNHEIILQLQMRSHGKK